MKLLHHCTVNEVTLDGRGQATGMLGHLEKVAAGSLPRDVPEGPIRINARVVIIAAGAIESPLLLQRSRVPDPYGVIGKGLVLHPSLPVIGIYPKEISNYRGITGNLWAKPHLGILMEASYRSVHSYDLYRQRLDGYEVRVSMDSFFSPQPWRRSKFAYEGGYFWQKAYLAHELGIFTGSQLSLVNKHLMGGSWDLPRVNKAYGSRLFQYRLEQGVVANLRADYPIFPSLDASLQIGYVGTEDSHSLGTVMKVFVLYRGLLWETGAAYQAITPFIFARLTFGIL